jgi:hypothetical protein
VVHEPVAQKGDKAIIHSGSFTLQLSKLGSGNLQQSGVHLQVFLRKLMLRLLVTEMSNNKTSKRLEGLSSAGRVQRIDSSEKPL